MFYVTLGEKAKYFLKSLNHLIFIHFPQSLEKLFSCAHIISVSCLWYSGDSGYAAWREGRREDFYGIWCIFPYGVQFLQRFIDEINSRSAEIHLNFMYLCHFFLYTLFTFKMLTKTKQCYYISTKLLNPLNMNMCEWLKPLFLLLVKKEVFSNTVMRNWSH